MAKIYISGDTKDDLILWHRASGIIRTGLRTLLVALIGGVCMVYAYIAFVELPADIKLKSEIRELEFNYQKLNIQLDALTGLMSTIELRVDYIYKITLGVEPSKISFGQSGQHSNRFVSLRDTKEEPIAQVNAMYTKVDLLRKKISTESISQDKLLVLAQGRQKMFAAIPAIQPISNQSLTALASGYGMRMHPFYHLIKMHEGVDFSAPEGTPIYATADGEVVAADTAFIGYGTMVIIDHGAGYQTRYAHLQEFIVKAGDQVKRGEPIAYVGNTGQSSAPHLHYEILLRGVPINPIHYFFRDLTPASYAKILELASIQNQSMGN